MDLNQVTYGNPTIETKALLNKKGLVDSLFEKFKNSEMPLNNSELTREELNEVADGIALLQDVENELYLKRYKSYDRSLVQTIITIFKQKGIDVQGVCEEILQDINPLIAKLKVHFNRPRPYQMANYYKFNLFPFNSYSANTPSYPSGHTVQAYVLLNVIGSMYPKLYKFSKTIIEDVAESRVNLGLHYPSDNDFAKEVGEAVLKNKQFAQKYGI
jgi:membrane-associated phospholipid phosphatase